MSKSPAALAKRLLKAPLPEPLIRRWHDFRWPSRWLSWLPGTSRQFGPPRRWVRLEDYFRRHAGSVREVLPRQLLPEPRINCFGAVPARFFSRLQRDIPPASVIELPEARVLGAAGWIVGERDSLLLDASYHAYWDQGMTADDHWILKRRRALPLRRLPGRTLSLASDFAAGGFAHFIHDSLCRLHLLELAGIDPAGFDHIYWPRLSSATVEKLVAASGLPADRILPADPQQDLECESLTATTFPGRAAHLTPPYAQFLRQRFAPAPLGAGRRIYLGRQGYSRQLSNAEEIERLLVSRGYEICSPHADPDILAKCAAATHIVSLEGSGFYNAFSAPPGTHVLIILPENGQTLPYNQMLAFACGHQLSLMMASSAAGGEHRLDPAQFSTALDAMDAPR